MIKSLKMYVVCRKIYNTIWECLLEDYVTKRLRSINLPLLIRDEILWIRNTRDPVFISAISTAIMMKVSTAIYGNPLHNPETAELMTERLLKIKR